MTDALPPGFPEAAFPFAKGFPPPQGRAPQALLSEWETRLAAVFLTKEKEGGTKRQQIAILVGVDQVPTQHLQTQMWLRPQNQPPETCPDPFSYLLVT